MGALAKERSRPRFELSSVTRIGRDPANELVSETPAVSLFHAVVRWASPGAWELRDLGSTNGTFVNGVQLKAGEAMRLGGGERILFGQGTEPWYVVDVSRPLPEARDVVSGERVFGTPHLLSLAGPEEEPVDLLEERVGNWVLERAGEIVPIRSGQVIVVGGRTLRLSLPLPAAETEDVPPPSPPVSGEPLGETSLTFYVSADLEQVTMVVEWDSESWECQRAYTRALLELAKVRLRDQESGRLPPSDHGWMYVDELCSLADYDGTGRLNVEIHRARIDVARRGIPNGPSIVERRRGLLRIGTRRIHVVHGGPNPKP